MSAKDHIKTILDMPFLEKERQIERIAAIIRENRGHPDLSSFDIAEAVIEAERQEVLSSLHISGVLQGALKALEDAEARVKELETVDPDLTIAYMAGAHDWKKRTEYADARIRELEVELSIALDALREIAVDGPTASGVIAAMALVKITLRKEQANG